MKKFFSNSLVLILTVAMVMCLSIGCITAFAEPEDLSSSESAVSSVEETSSQDVSSQEDASEETTSEETTSEETASEETESQASGGGTASQEGNSSNASSTTSSKKTTSKGSGGGKTFIDEYGSTITITTTEDEVEEELEEGEDEEEHYVDENTLKMSSTIAKVMWIPIVFAVLSAAGLVYFNVFYAKKYKQAKKNSKELFGVKPKKATATRRNKK